MIVFGSYPFDGPKPWLALKDNAKALDITPAMLEERVKPHMQEILSEQEKARQYEVVEEITQIDLKAAFSGRLLY